MYKNVLQNMDNIAIWPVISFIIFFLFFLCLLWWVFTADKGLIEKMKNLPIDKLPEEKSQSSKIECDHELR